jgi:hypothetical protein
MASVADKPSVLRQNTPSNLGDRGFPVLSSLRQLVIGDTRDINAILNGVNDDGIAILDQGNRSSDRSLGRDVSDLFYGGCRG